MPTSATPAHAPAHSPVSARASAFVPPGFDGADWLTIRPLIDELKARPVASVAELERWLIDRGELEAACGDASANLYIAMTCNTEDKAVNDAYSRYIETIPPLLKPELFELDNRTVELADRFPLPRERYAVLERSKRNAVHLYRPENVPLETELAKLSQTYGKIAGAMTVNFDGQERPLPQMARYLQVADRTVRESSWRATQERRLRDRAPLNDLLSEMLRTRHRVALNAGCASYVEHAFLEKERFDYTPAHCRDFWSAVEKHVVPFMRRCDARRESALGLAAGTLRPWDLHVDVKGRAPLAPFSGGRELVARSARAFDALDPRLSAMFRRMAGPLADADSASSPSDAVTPYLDLDSRKGKRPGGYMYYRQFARKPFIFMNAAGLQRDVITMLHEAGHAFHAMLCEHEQLRDYREYPTEFAEVASMTMELLTQPHWSGAVDAPARSFYSSETDRARAVRDHLEGAAFILPWIATIDAFQHWMYAPENIDHSPADRDRHWLELDARFGHAVSWAGLDAPHENDWQKQGHIFSHPMYYIEYGIAQLGALQLWLMSLTRGSRVAIDHYLKALALGGSRPLPELFAAAGIPFDFGDKAVGNIIEAIERELDKLPD